MTIGVTGASGHLGNVVCRFLLEKGYHVRALYNKDKTSLEDKRMEIFQGNVLNPGDLEGFVSGCDLIINSAAIISIYGDPTGIVFKTNTEGPKNIVNACVKKGVKNIIHISSVHAVMELPYDTPFDENRPYKTPESFAYDFSKATGEKIILDAIEKKQIQGFILRPSSIVGPYDFKPSELGKALIDFYNENIPLLPPGGYNFVDVRDVAETVLSSLGKGKNGEIYLLSGKYYTMKEFSQIIRRVSGKKVPRFAVPFWVLRLILPFVKVYGRIKKAAPVFTQESIAALKNGHPNMDNRKAIEKLDHRCRPLEESIRDFYQWNRERKKIQ